MSLGSVRFTALVDMKIYIPVVLVCLFSSLTSLTSLAQLKVVEFANIVEDGDVIQATGLLVDDEGTFATVALHQADPAKASVKDADGKNISLELISHDTISRITLYKLPEALQTGTTKMGKLANTGALSAGDSFVADITKPKKTSSMVSFVRKFNGRILPITFIRANVDEQEVMAGSPVYNDAKELVGLAYQPTADKTSIYILPARVIIHLKASAVFGKVFKPCWIGVSMDHLSDAPRIIGVRPEAPAKSAGLMKGDILISISGIQVTDYPEVVNAFYYLKRNEPTKFKILRGTDVKEMTVTPEVNPIFK